MRRSGIPLLSLFALTLIVSFANGQTSGPQSLQPGTPVERTIGANESNNYTINLDEKQYVQFVVNQQGIDLIVRVYSPTGKSLGSFDSPNGTEGPENVSFVAMTNGAYRIEVAALDPNTTERPGRYEIKILDIREATEQELKVGNDAEARKAKGLSLLTEIINSIPEIRQPQTKVRVKLQCAALLWSIDEKKAGKFLAEAVTDARNYLSGLDPDDQYYDEAAQWVNQIRFEAIQTMAFRDPEGALNLLRSTRKPVNTEAERREFEPERQLELSLASQIAAKNPQRAFELAEESLKDGFTNTQIQTMNSLARVSPELASTLAKDLSQKLVADRNLRFSQGLDLALSLLRQFNSDAKNQNRQLLSEQDYRALVQKLLNEGLAATPINQRGPNEERGGFTIDGRYEKFFVMKGNATEMILSSLQEFAGNSLDQIMPGASAAVEKKLKELRGPNSNVWNEYENKINNSSDEEARDVIRQAPPEMRLQLLQRLAEQRFRSGDIAAANRIITESSANPREQRRALNDLERQAAYQEANQCRMDEALKHLAKLSNSEMKAEVIGEFANRIGAGLKRSAALALLENARAILGISIQAESPVQMFALLQLAGAFSRYDGNRAFQILEPLIDQFNELSQAARTINGFGPTYFVEGELSYQNGNSLAGIAAPMSSTLGILSLVDFDRAKTTSDRLQLPEVRLNVHLSIVQQAIMPNGLYSPSVANLNILNR